MGTEEGSNLRRENMGDGKIRMAVLLSGSGTTFQYIQDRIEEGKLSAETMVVVSSREDAGGLERARKHDIPALAVSRKKYNEKYGPGALEAFNRAIVDEIEPYNVDLVVLAGFMSLISPEFVRRYPARMMNTHPALIPMFCGENFYGDKVHKAVVEYGVKVTGCTIHFVDEKYDSGPVIIQKAVPVYHNDTYKDVAARVQAAEKPAYCEAIQLFAEGRLEVVGRIVHVKDAEG